MTRAAIRAATATPGRSTQKALKGMDYPASKAAVVECAERSHADGVIDMLRRIPDREYGTPASVSKELGRLM